MPDAAPGDPGFDQVHDPECVLPPLQADTATLSDRKARWRSQLADTLYGAMPDPPDRIDITRHPITGEQAERLSLTLHVADRRFTVDAALWLPRGPGPHPLIVGLDFTGPAGILTSDAFPLDPHAVIHSRPDYGARDGGLDEVLRGTSAYRWPVGMLCDAGHAVLVSCYGSWVPDDRARWTGQGLYPLLACNRRAPRPGAITLWAWAVSRLIDAALTLDVIDPVRITATGHSRLGKAALWAAANDPRIGTVFANASGCGGAAPAQHRIGETLAQMADRFPHWTLPSSGNPAPLPVDQQHLLACLSPRAVYLASARDDIWADPVGSYLALTAAAPVWPGSETQAPWPAPQTMWDAGGQIRRGALGCHLRPGGHDLLPHDWRLALRFMSHVTQQ